MIPSRPSPCISGATAPLRRAAFFASALVLLAAVLVIPAHASAAIRYFPQGRLAPPAPGTPFSGNDLEAESVAPDDANGHILVADSGNGQVYDYSSAADTSPSIWDGSDTPSGSFGGSRAAGNRVTVAVDDSSGDVYVADKVDGLIDKFDAEGNLISSFGDAQPTPDGQLGGAATPAGSFSPPENGALGLAVDQATGDLYVIDAGHKVIDIFTSSGGYLRQITATPTGLYTISTDSIAVSGLDGEVYVAESGGITDELFVFDSAGAYLETRTGSDTPDGSFGGGYVNVAVSDSTGEVLVTDSTHDVADVFSSAGSYLTQFGANLAYGIAADPSSADVYASIDGGSAVEIFHPFLTPDVSTQAATAPTATAAVLHGTVNTAGTDAEAALADCHFEYATQAEGFGGIHVRSAPCEPAAGLIPDDGADHAVSATISALAPGTTYSFRLRAENQNHHPSLGGVETLSTLPNPQITLVSATHVTATEATLQGRINPRGYDTHYYFQWGSCASLAACPTSPYETTVPALPGTDIGQGAAPVAVSTQLKGLNHDTTYHFRLVAENANGLAASPDNTFVYLTEETQLEHGCANETLRVGPATHLPDCRAYEKVTPNDMNGALIGQVPLGNFQDIAANGERMIVSSVQCFAQSKSCNADRENEGEPVALERGPGGWTATSLSPPADESTGNTPYGSSADAGTALFAIPTPPVGEDDFYRRNPDGTFTDIGKSGPAAGEQLQWNASTVLATSDATKIAYTGFDPSRGGGVLWVRKLVSGASPIEFATKNGTSERLTECDIELGAGIAIRSPGEMSADGKQLVFTATACGTHVKRLYIARESAGTGTTTEISARSTTECDSVCQSSPEEDAKFQGAGNDGTPVFFTSEQQLTTSATEHSPNLYAYDVAAEELLDISAGDSSGVGPDVRGVVAISSDGSTVYFVAGGVLTSAANRAGEVATRGADNLYMYQRNAGSPVGRLAFVATLAPSDSDEWAHVGDALVANVTPDGNRLLFTSHADLTPDDHAGTSQVFRYDSTSGALIRLSRGEAGFDDDGNDGVAGASIVAAAIGMERLGPARSDPSMSDDGAYVFFESPDALTPGALDDRAVNSSGGLAENVYEWEEDGRGGCLEVGGCVSLISDGQDTTEVAGGTSARLLGTDIRGENVFFRTADPLLPADTGGGLDYYDARVEGGFAEPPAPEPCQGDACKGKGSEEAPGGSPATPGFSGPEEGSKNPYGTRCPKGKVRRHGRCVAKPHHRKGRRRHHAGKRRAAGFDRGRTR